MECIVVIILFVVVKVKVCITKYMVAYNVIHVLQNNVTDIVVVAPPSSSASSSSSPSSLLSLVLVCGYNINPDAIHVSRNMNSMNFCSIVLLLGRDDDCRLLRLLLLLEDDSSSIVSISSL